MNAAAISQLTGKSAPLSFLDEVEASDEQSLTAKASVSMNENFFQGHFPGNPVMPGVLIIESLVQAVEVLTHKHLKLQQVKKARFHKMVKPGDQLTIKVNRSQKDDGFEAQALLGEELACSAKLYFF
ncbi:MULTISPECIES: 3-hydroxyacyl-ACP dehydratase FabZ family protein [Lactobacillus]|uniref:Beta-hydroxyacyl-ACP dehydratase n=1 Tax=Lactobacillus xujianguonis TaxID=2495899 RepID=A0A437STZ6_9LACO|nr:MULTISPECIES: 3-hydroxyacyl-ACP dehydratase FabZ family protein [Lactobacillus]RVU70354.1 beta-hydroxyacyl-ACP dehydratase [Lactobacillus xujianguonis]RVU76900.1 beta-hydroxyacyl-ACP dehydratase [Lactobacillus xujianguonis]